MNIKPTITFKRITSRKNCVDIWSKFKWLLISQYVQCIWKLSPGVVAKKSRKLRTGSEFCWGLASLFCTAAPILLVWAKIVKNWNFVHDFIIGVNGRCNHSIVFIAADRIFFIPYSIAIPDRSFQIDKGVISEDQWSCRPQG